MIKIFATESLRSETLAFYCEELEFRIVSGGQASSNSVELTNFGQELLIWFTDKKIRSSETGLTFQISDFSAALTHMKSLDCVVAGSISSLEQAFCVRDPSGNIIKFQRLSTSSGLN